LTNFEFEKSVKEVILGTGPKVKWWALGDFAERFFTAEARRTRRVSLWLSGAFFYRRGAEDAEGFFKT
jgi:hypothetical protein